MKKEYEKPVMTVARFEVSEYLTTSVGRRNNDKCTMANCAKTHDEDKRF